MRRRLVPRDLVLALRELPSPPAVFSELNAVLSEREWRLSQVTGVLATDPALCARLLRLANSPYYGVPREVASIDDAVTLLGGDELKALVFATTVLEHFRDIPPGLIDLAAFQCRAVRVAVAASLLRRQQGESAPRSEAFVSGLVHDIGSLAVCMQLPEAAREVLLASPQQRHGIEREVFSTLECAVGGALLAQWRLPAAVAEAVRWHAAPEHAEGYRRPAARLGLAVELADGRAPSRALCHAAGLDPRVADEVLPHIDTAYRKAMAVLR